MQTKKILSIDKDGNETIKEIEAVSPYEVFRAIEAENSRIEATYTTPTEAENALNASCGIGTITTEAKQRRDKILADSEQSKQQAEWDRQAKQATQEKNYQAGDGIDFLGDEIINPDLVELQRSQEGDSKKWFQFVTLHYPDLDANEQRLIKLAENRGERVSRCGAKFSYTSLAGERKTIVQNCEVWQECEDCRQQKAATIKRALDEIQGHRTSHTGEYSREMQAKALRNARRANVDLFNEQSLEDYKVALKSKQWDIFYEAWCNYTDDPGEDSAPLPIVGGGLSVVALPLSERAKFTRQLKRQGVSFKAFPYEDRGLKVDFIVNNNDGMPLAELTFEHILLWAVGAVNDEGNAVKTSGNLIPNHKELLKQFRHHERFEVVNPERVKLPREYGIDKNGRRFLLPQKHGLPIDNDIIEINTFSVKLHGLSIEALPLVALPQLPTTEIAYQQCLEYIRDKQLVAIEKQVGSKTASFMAYIEIKRYTRLSTLKALLFEFGKEQNFIRLQLGLPPLDL